MNNYYLLLGKLILSLLLILNFAGIGLAQTPSNEDFSDNAVDASLINTSTSGRTIDDLLYTPNVNTTTVVANNTELGLDFFPAGNGRYISINVVVEEILTEVSIESDNGTPFDLVSLDASVFDGLINLRTQDFNVRGFDASDIQVASDDVDFTSSDMTGSISYSRGTSGADEGTLTFNSDWDNIVRITFVGTSTGIGMTNAVSIAFDNFVFGNAVVPNMAPTFTMFGDVVETTDEDTAVEITFAELAAQGDEADSDGTVDEFRVQAVSSGSLTIGGNPFNGGTNDIINAATSASWTPALNASGTAVNAFTVVVADDDGEESVNVVQATVEVTAVNDLPTFTTLAGVVETTNEETEVEVTFAEIAAQGNETDVDGSVTAFRIIGLLDGHSVRVGANSGAALPVDFSGPSNNIIDASNNAYVTPNTDIVGASVNIINIRAVDNEGGESTNNVTMSIAVNDVNDAPTFTQFADVVETTDEDTAVEITFAELAAQGNEADVDGTVDEFRVQAVSSGTLTIGGNPFMGGSNDIITAATSASWTPAMNASGAAVNAFTVVVADNDGEESVNIVQATVEVTEVNDAPTFTMFDDVVSTTDEDTGIEIAFIDLSNASNAVDVDGTVDEFRVQAVSSGTLTIGGNPFVGGSNDAIIAGSSAVWTPSANSNGTAVDAFTVVVADDDGEESVNIVQATVEVVAVNDVPSFDLPAMPDQAAPNDAGAVTVSGFATSIMDGDPEVMQVLTFNVSNDGNSLFAVQPDIDEGSGDLTFTPATGMIGTATVTVSLMDNGGTANDGVDESAEVTFDIEIEPRTVTWTGNVDDDWGTAGNWDANEVPGMLDNVAIADVMNSPVVASSGAFVIDNLEIETDASLEIEAVSNSGGRLAVLGDFVNDGSLDIASGGEFAVAGDRSGAGSETARRSLTGNQGLNIIGSPISGQTVADLSADFTFLYDNDAQTFVVPPGGTAIDAGQGLFVGYDVAAPELVLTGEINTGNVDFPIRIESDGFNLVANPYTFSIDFEDFIANTNNSTNTTGTIYLWNDGGVNVGNLRGGDYVAVNLMGMTVTATREDPGNGTPGLGSPNDFNDNILSFQGFFVESSVASGDVSFTIDMAATDGNADDNFIRDDNGTIERDIVKLSLQGQGDLAVLYNEIIVGLDPNASTGTDYALDARKFAGNPDISFYSLQEEQQFAIQALPKLQDETVEVELGMDLRHSGNYTISVVGLGLTTPGLAAYLTDHFTGEVYNLSEGIEISFAANQGDASDGRFSLSFAPSTVTTVDNELAGSLEIVSGNRAGLRLAYPGTDEVVALYDLSGKTLFEDGLRFENGQADIAVHLNPGQVYVVQVQNEAVKFIVR